METEKTMFGGKKPIIGVMPLVDEEKESYWMLPGYFNGIREAGAVPVMLPSTDDEEELRKIAETFDGFVFTGGPDVSPEHYHAAQEVDNLRTCEVRDHMEIPLLKMVMELYKPVLGICRGMQLINVALGGTLYQDLPKQRPSDIKHSQEKPYDNPSHKVRVIKDTPFYAVAKGALDEEGLLGVNSCHHQGVKDLGKGLLAMAEAVDGLVEAYYAPGNRFTWGVQWHPEFMYLKDDTSKGIFKAFVEHCN